MTAWSFSRNEYPLQGSSRYYEADQSDKSNTPESGTVDIATYSVY